MNPIERLLSKLPHVKRNGRGWLARCPAHQDRRPSLSIAQGADGRALIHCHAGCSTQAILAALGMTLPELMPVRDHPPAREKKPPAGKPRGANSATPVYATARQAIAQLERAHGRRAARWTYRNAEGQPVGVVVRWNRPDGGKVIRPVSRHGNGWRIAAMPEPRPLYRLPELLTRKGEVVYVAEGEKCADALAGLGLLGTTSAHGAESAAKSDFSPLAGRDVVILPDADDAGRNYSAEVARRAHAAGARSIRIVHLSDHAPNLPEGGDIADVLADPGWCGLPLGDAAEPGELAQWLIQQAESTESWRPDESWCGDDADDLAYRPFPTDALPKAMARFVEAGAKSIGCDPSYLALPLLTAIAAAIGTTRRLELKRSWSAPAILWGAIIGESGTAKTPAFRLVMRPIRERQRKALERHAHKMQRYEAELAHWEREMAAWKRQDIPGDPPPRPAMPHAARFIVSDTTVEALAPLLLENPRGLLLARDELAGWIASFDRYANKGRASADAANWLSMFNAESIIVDRKTGTPRTIHVSQAAVCVCGGVQPGTLRRALGLEHRESGLAARLLLTCPPRQAKRWTEADIDPNAEAALVRLFDKLLELQPEVGDDGGPHPLPVRLTPDAKELWKAFYNAHAVEQTELTGDMAAAFSKLEEYAARLALVVHCARWAAGDVPDQTRLDRQSMDAGIRLAQWFKHEARRAYAMLDESDDDRDQRRLLEWISRRGGAVTARQVQMGCRWLRDPGAAETALQELVMAGRGTWQHSPSGQRGQPTRRFRLAGVNTVNVNGNTHFVQENANTVDVDAVDNPRDADTVDNPRDTDAVDNPRAAPTATGELAKS